MSYSVMIRRCEYGSWGTLNPITLDEWLAYVRNDHEMVLKGEFSATTPKGAVIKAEAPGLAEWTCPQTGKKSLFDHRRGGITIGNPSKQTLTKVCQIAAALGAIVQGEEGERYDS